MTRKYLIAKVLSIATLLCGISGCCSGEDADDQQNESPDADPVVEIDETTPLGQTALEFGRWSEGGVWRGEIEKVLSRWGGRRRPMTDLLRKTYQKRSYSPVFLDGLWPNESAAVMIKAVREIPSHGLPHSPYRPKALIPLYSAIALETSDGQGTLTDALFDNERLAKLEWQMPRSVYKNPKKSEKVPEVRYRPLKDLPDLPRISKNSKCLLKIVKDVAAKKVGDGEDRAKTQCGIDETQLESELAKLRKTLDQRSEHLSSLALFDALTLTAYYQWILDFSVDLRVHPFSSLGPINRTRLPEQKRDQFLARFPQTEDVQAFRKTLLSSMPHVPQYDLTRKALGRYVKLMDEGNQKVLRATERLEKGSTGEATAALQERLKQEGYYDGPVDGTFSEETHNAVVQYQRTHHLADGGIVGDDTIENLNIPFEWRVKQLLASLGRWRESDIVRKNTPDLYIRVNLPAFELRVIQANKEIRRHKVIVGSNRRVADPLNDGKVWHQRRTKLFNTVLNEVVLNPNWIVPEAIRIDEIRPKVQENENYLTEHNFKKVGDLLVQGPTETNPLGVVKFTLESTDSIYLHDTDKRWLFKEYVRDLSHGCIRVDQPVELAKFILDRQDVDHQRIDRRIQEKSTLTIKVKSPIPIFVEYNTVEFTSSGEPIFYRDIYNYDVAYWKKRTPITRRFY